jgi:hypothetical protein
MSATQQQHRRPPGARVVEARRATRSQRTWIAAGGLLLVAGLAGAVATNLHWAGCGVSVSTAACRELQDRSGSLPLLAAADPRPVLALGGLCALAVAVSWLLVVVSARLRPTLTVCAALVGLQPALAAAAAFTGDALPGALGTAVDSLWFYLVPDVVALVFAASVLMTDDVLSGLDRARWVLLTVAVTAFGPVTVLLENLVLAYLHPEIADAVPGAGYGVAGLLVVVGVALLVSTTLAAVRRPRTPARTTAVRRSLVRA